MSKKGGWTKTPNDIYDAMPGMCEAELRVTLTVIRLTYGYQKERAEITYEDFTIHGGITSRSSISKGIKLMLRRGFFAKGNGQSEYVIPARNSTLNGLSSLSDSPQNELSDEPNSPDSVPPIYSKERKNNNNDYDLTSDEQFAFSFFEGTTGFCPPHQSSSDYHDHWLVPIQAIVKKSNGRTEIEDRIAHAVHQMQGGSGKNYTIKSPKSILTFALNWGNKPDPSSNGHTNGIHQPPTISPPTADEAAEFEKLIANTEAIRHAK